MAPNPSPSVVFRDEVTFLIEHEGGFIDHPSDRGGATAWGLTLPFLRRVYDPLVTVETLRRLSCSRAIDIYLTEYYDRVGLGKIHNAGLRLMVVDSAMQHGVSWAVHALQEVAGAISDGFVGPHTLRAVNNGDPCKLKFAILSRRLEHYGDLLFNHRNQLVFASGWFRRLASVSGRVGGKITCHTKESR